MNDLDKAIERLEVLAAEIGWNKEGSAWLKFAEILKKINKRREIKQNEYV